MLNAKAFANAVTAVTAVFYLACVLVSYLAPDIVFGIAQSWMHSVNLDSIRSTQAMSLGATIWGLVTISLFTWLTAYITIWLYNRWAKR